MPVGVYPTFRPKLRGVKIDTLGEAIAAALGDLEELAAEARLVPLSAFMDDRDVPDDFDGAPEELAEAQGAWMEWFDPAAGAAALTALAVSAPDPAADELRELSRVLAVAAAKGVQFRLVLG